MKVAFICVNYNNSQVTIDYINSVQQIENLSNYCLDIIIVDNDSEKKQIEILENEIALNKFKNVSLIKSAANVGYFKGLNLGINHVNVKEYDFLIIGNNDLLFKRDFVKNLDKLSIANNIFALAPNIIRQKDGIHQNPHIISKFSKIQNLYREIYFTNYYISIIVYFFYNIFRPIIFPANRAGHSKEQIILMGYGACYILTKNFFNYFSELDAPVFLMGEEGILANQIKRANGETLFVPSLEVTHLDHTSIGKVPSVKLFEYSKTSYKHYKKNLTYLH